MTSHIRKESVDGSVETHLHSVMINNRHRAFVVVTIPDSMLERQHQAWGRNPCLSAKSPQNLVTFRHSTIKLRLLR